MFCSRYASKVNPNLLLLVLNLALVDSVTLSTSPFTAYVLIWGFTFGDSMKSVCLLNSVINPFLYAFTLRKKLNKSGAEHNDTTTMTVRKCSTLKPYL
ncbi:unnamed protein product [Merluccius merluccius]